MANNSSRPLSDSSFSVSAVDYVPDGRHDAGSKEHDNCDQDDIVRVDEEKLRRSIRSRDQSGSQQVRRQDDCPNTRRAVNPTFAIGQKADHTDDGNGPPRTAAMIAGRSGWKRQNPEEADRRQVERRRATTNP